MAINEDEDEIECEETTTIPPPEGGWGWVVCLAAFFSTFTIFGIHNSFGVFYINLVDELKLGEAETAWIGSVAGSLNFLCGPIASILCDRYGCRPVAFTGGILSVLGLFLTSFIQEPPKMYVTYGLLWGLGSGLSFTPSIVVLGEYFQKRFPLVSGIASSGSGVGGLLAAPFIQYLLSTIKWQNSMRVLACIANILWIAALFYRPRNKHNKSTSDQQRNSGEISTVKHASVWKSKPYVVLVVAVATFQLCYPVPYMHLVKFSEDVGIPSTHGAWLLGILSITATVSKIIFGKISETGCVNRRFLFQISMFVMGLSTMLCPLATNYTGVLCYVLIFGLFDGCFVMQMPVVTADIVGHERLSRAVGNMFGAVAVPMSFGPPIAGWLYQAFGSYNGAFHVAGGVAIFTSLLLFLIPCLARRHYAYDITDDVTYLPQAALRRPEGINMVVRFTSERSSKSGSFAAWQLMMPARRKSYEVAVREDTDEELKVVQRETVL